MKTVIALALVATVSAMAPALAQSAGSMSASGSNAVSNGGAAYNANIFTSPSHVTSSGRLRTAPSVVAPGLAASAVETCMGSSSAGGSGMGWGFSIGTTYNDGGCEARLDARTLFAMGQKDAALYRLCERPHMAEAFLAAGTPCPQDRARALAARQQQAAAAGLYRQPPVYREPQATRQPVNYRQTNYRQASLRQPVASRQQLAYAAPSRQASPDAPTGIFSLFAK